MSKATVARYIGDTDVLMPGSGLVRKGDLVDVFDTEAKERSDLKPVDLTKCTQEELSHAARRFGIPDGTKEELVKALRKHVGGE